MGTTESAQAEVDKPLATAGDRPADTMAWVIDGVGAGIAGAAVVAVLFFVIDLLQGQPFWTPAALGSALFRGVPLEVGDPPALALIAGYTAVHGTIFLGFGLIAASAIYYWQRTPPFLAVAAALFVCIEICFLVFAALFVPQLAGTLGWGWVALANLLAALAMGGVLVGRMRSRPR